MSPGRALSTLSAWAAHATGTSTAFLLAVGLVAGWAATGPYFGWSDSHSLFINTATTVITFLQCFLIQRAQNRDSAAAQAKLDEIVRALDRADDRLIGVEKKVDEDLGG